MNNFAIIIFHRIGRENPFAVFILIGFMRNHPLGEQPQERLIAIHESTIAHNFGEKPRIKQMKYGVLDPANILLDRHPVFRFGLVRRQALIFWIAIAELIPATFEECVKCIGFASCWLSSFRACRVFPSRVIFQRISSLRKINIFR